MALDERYIVASDLEQYFVDKDSGLPLANGTLTFYRDSARNVPKEVFQLSGSPPNYGYTSMGAQITLSAVGTVQNAGGDNEVIYYYPYDSEGNLDLYYVVCRDEDGIEQFTREAWPNVTSANDPTRDQFPVQNQISNSTFTNVFINEGRTTTYTVSAATNQVFEFAPNWDFVISGTGTVVVERIAVTGNENVPTSPPYVIDITVSLGITACYLRQRFSYNSGLWASTDNRPLFLSGNIVARNEGVGTTGMQMLYAESSGGSPIVIVDATFQGTYQLLSGATENAIPLSTNTDSGADGYVDIYLSFIAGTQIRFGGIQVVPVASNSTDLVSYDVDSSNRNEAYQGDYYLPRAAAKRIRSFLVGWDFPLNPYQFGSSGNIATSAGYIIDQTIALRGSTGNVAWTFDPVSYGLQFTTAGTNDAFYIMQYLSLDQVKDMVGSRLAVNVFGYKTAAGDDVTMRIYLFRGSSSASFPTLPTSIGTLASNGVFTLSAANWTEIPRSGLDTPQTTLSEVAVNSEINNDSNDYGFSGWEITDSTQLGDTDKFAIVVTFAYADASTVITVNSVSVVPGDLPCRPAIQTFDDVIRECQYYYEKSYDINVVEGTVSSPGTRIESSALYESGGNQGYYLKSFTVVFNTKKRTAPVIRFYNPSATTANRLFIGIFLSGTGFPSSLTINSSTYTSSASVSSVTMIPNTPVQQISASTNSAQEGVLYYQYAADARLGVV